MVRFHKKLCDNKWLGSLFGQVRKPSLFRILVIPFVVLSVTIVGLTSFVSYKNAQNAVNDLANQLIAEIGNRIDQNLSSYMQNIEKITRTNASLVQSGMLDPSDPASLRQHFWEQLHNYELASTVAMCTEKRDFTALERDNISFILREYDKNTKKYTSYRLNEKAEKTGQTGVLENYDPLKDPPHDPWYEKTKAQKGSSWILVVTMAKGVDDPELMIVNFLPIYDKEKKMLGVAASSIYLSQFGQFLTSLKIGQSGQAFVIDRQGNLIATSTGETPFRQKNNTLYPETLVTEKGRIAAVDSNNPVTSASIKAIIGEYGNLDRFTQSQLFNFSQAGVRYLTQIIPIKKDTIDWLTVIIVPEADFMALINQNARYNLFFSILASLVAIVIGIFAVRWVTGPILYLNAAAKAMASGEWDKPLTIARPDEIGELTSTFNNMATKLKISFDLLQQEIVERKRMGEAIRESEERFRHLLKNIPSIAIQGYRLDGTTTYWNQASERLYGYAEHEAIGRSLLDLIIPQEIRREVLESIQHMTETGEPIPSAELSLMRKDGSRVAVFSNHALVHLPDAPPELFCLDIDLTERKYADAALHESESRFRMLAEKAPFGLTLMRQDLSFEYINPQFENIFGYTVEDLQNKGIWFEKAYPDPEYRRHVMQTWKGDLGITRETRGHGDRIYKVHCKNGQDKVIHFRSAIFDDGRHVMTYEDVTDQVGAEEALRDSQARFRMLAEKAPFGLTLMKEDLTFEYLNPCFTKIFGYTIEDLPNKNAWFGKAYPDSEYRERVMNIWNNDVGSAKEKGRSGERIFRVRCKEGQEKYIRFQSIVIEYGKHLETYQDITDQVRSEEALRDSEEKYRLLVDNAGDAICVVQEDVIRFANPKMLELSGYSNDELSSIPIESMIHPEDRQRIIAKHLQMMKRETTTGITIFKGITKTGGELWLDVNAVSVMWEQKPAAIYFLRDITRQRQMEKQLLQAHKMEAIGTLAGGIAHDFNNILTGIMGYTELCLRAVQDHPRVNQGMEQVLKAANRARDLVQQILTFSRKTEQEKIPVVLAPIAKEVAKFMRASLPTTIGIKQTIEETSNVILADPTQMHQVLMNLCTNAGHAMKETGGILEIGLKEVVMDAGNLIHYPAKKFGRYLEISVQDSGHGISQENLGRIFDPYFTTKKKGEGTGLGLAVVHGIIKDHGGEIRVYSEVGKGTTFRVYLPLMEENVEGGKEIEETSQPGKGETILFVDDEEVVVDLSRELLEALGYRVVTETDPVQAVEIFKRDSHKFDIVITDRTMPNMTGFDVTREIRGIRADIPVLLCSGLQEKEDLEKMKTLGISQLIIKPFRMSALAKAIQNVLDGEKS